MSVIPAVLFAFAAGAAFCGMAMSGMGALAGQRPGFHTPFVSREHLLRSFAVMLCAGPFILIDTVRECWREGAVDAVSLAAALMTAGCWTLAVGVVVVEAVVALALL